MVQTMLKTGERPVNTDPCERGQRSIEVASTVQKIGDVKPHRRGTTTIALLIAVFDTPDGTIAATTRAPNALKKELTAKHGSARLVDVIVPKGTSRSRETLVAARRLLKIRAPLNGPSSVAPNVLVRAIRVVRAVDTARNTYGRLLQRFRNGRSKAIASALSI